VLVGSAGQLLLNLGVTAQQNLLVMFQAFQRGPRLAKRSLLQQSLNGYARTRILLSRR